MSSPHLARVRRLIDVRWRTLAALAIAITVGGWLLSALDGIPSRSGAAANLALRTARSTEPVRQEIHQRFQQGVIMLHAKQHEHAMAAFHKVLELDPALPEAHVNMGFALIGLERYAAARDFFESALALRKEQVNAYYGLAVVLEGLQDRAGAIGAMRTFVHLSRPNDPYVRKAQSALWEWETARDNTAATNTFSKTP
ncbi:MAG: tetratricopeptide repeat protein [Betaproteobacteria bacterium]